MKRLYLTIICLGMLFLTSCEDEKSDEKASNDINIEYTQKEIETMVISLKNCEIVLNKIEKGSFEMGSYEGIGEEDELPVRNITITEDFYIGAFEITQKQWEAVMGNNPSGFKGDNLPVETVTYTECIEFCKKLSEISGYKVSLPTEAQWEYACRAGSKSKWFFGDDEAKFDNYGETDVDVKTYEVGKFKPNPNGLYDMYGNVMEWCMDYYSSEYLEDDVKNPKGPDEGEARVSRGGGYGGSLDACRSGYRNACGENDASDGIGFRIVVKP